MFEHATKDEMCAIIVQQRKELKRRSERLDSLGHAVIRLEMDVEELVAERDLLEWQLGKLVTRITNNWRKLRFKRLEA